MAARNPQVGSVAWIAKERSTVKQLEEQDIEDVAYVVRGDMEWLNEHMANIFERNIFDMAEIMKTPGRLRGRTPLKTPRSVRQKPTKLAEDRGPAADVFVGITHQVNRLQEAVAESSKNYSSPAPPARPELFHSNELQPSPDKIPARSSPRKYPSLQKADTPVRNLIKEVAIPPSAPPVEHILPTPSFADSGFFASTNLNSQPEAVYDKPRSRDSIYSQTSARDSSDRELRPGEPIQEQTSFITAPEDIFINPPSSPIDEVSLLRQRSPHRPPPKQEQEQEPEHTEPIEEAIIVVHPSPVRILRESPTKPPSSVRKINAAPVEPRRSGRLALASPTPETIFPSPTGALDEDEMEIQESAVESVEAVPTYPTLPVPEPEDEQLETEMPEPEEEHLEAETQEPEDEIAEAKIPEPMAEVEVQNEIKPVYTVRSPSPAPTPEAPPPRTSSMNFASLPARAPLTGKKKSTVVRESHLEQLIQGGSQRASWISKKGNGKSLSGSSRPIVQPEEDEVMEEKEESEEPEPRTGDKRGSDGSSSSSRPRKMSRGDDVLGVLVQETTKIPTKGGDDESDGEEERLHNKTATQRIHDKISQLGKSNTRTARSFPALANLAYPDISAHEQEPLVPCKTPAERLVGAVEDTIFVMTPVRPHHGRSKTVGANLASKEVEKVEETELCRSPRRQSPSKTTEPAYFGGNHTNGATPFEPVVDIPSPKHAALVSPPSTDKMQYASIEDIPQLAAAAPAKKTSPESALSTVKATTTSMFQKAKEMLMMSSVASASAKTEALISPPGPSLRKFKGTDSLQDIYKRDGTAHDLPIAKVKEVSNVSVGSGFSPAGATKPIKRDTPVFVSSPLADTYKEERQTRNSRVRAEEATSRSTTPADITFAESKPKPAPLGRQTRNSKSKEEVRSEALESTPPSKKKKDQDMELEELRERQRRQRLEEITRMANADLVRLEPRKEDDHRKREASLGQEEHDDEDSLRREHSRSRLASTEPDRPASRMQKTGMRFQKPEPKRTVKTTKGPSKPAPVSIKIGTASQREMQDQRHKSMAAPSGNNSLVNALKNSFESLPTMNPTSSNNAGPSLHTSSSNGSLRSATSANTNKSLKSLQSAANQRKKEQEDKERRVQQKKELEKRRTDQRKQEDDERKRIQAIRQKATTPGPSGSIRVKSQASLRQTSQEPEANKKGYGSLKQAASYAQGSIKRALPQDPEEQPTRHAPSRPGTAASYHQDGPKKRRTNEAYEMPPPIRASMVKKVDNPNPTRGKLVSMGLHQLTGGEKELAVSKPLGYAQSSASASASSSASTKPSSSSSRAPQVESVKFSKEKIRFAGETPAGPTPAAFKTPGTGKSKKHRTPAAFKESPLYPNGEDIALPDIPTDSEDEDDYPKKTGFHVPQWAESPELRALLRQQQTVDPSAIFGPMAKLDMDAIFKDQGKQGRFRARTSSANWGGTDRLTQLEIQADQEARKKITEAGKWTPMQ